MKLLRWIVTMVVCVSSIQAWEVVPTTTLASLRSLQFIGTDTGYAFGDSGVYLKTTNGGTAWIKLSFAALKANLGPAQFITGRTGWVVAGGDSLYKTTDGGVNWSFVTKASADIRAFSFINVNTGWFALVSNDSLEVFKTTDGGVHTLPVYGRKENLMVSGGLYVSIPLRSSGPKRIFFGAVRVSTVSSSESWGEILTDSGQGTAWSNLSTSSSPWKAGQFLSNDTGFAVVGYTGYTPPGICGVTPLCPGGTFQVSNIQKTTNGGATWVNRVTPSKILNNITFSGKSIGYAVGNSGLVMKTTDGGDSWLTEAPITNRTLYAVEVASSTTAFAVGDSGTLLKTDPSAAVIVGIQTKLESNTLADLANGVIVYRLPYALEVSLTVRDALGRPVWNLQRVEAPGNHSLSLPFKILPAGKYFLDFRAGSVHRSWPVIKRP